MATLNKETEKKLKELLDEMAGMQEQLDANWERLTQLRREVVHALMEEGMEGEHCPASGRLILKSAARRVIKD
jgi:hypothetical protein